MHRSLCIDVLSIQCLTKWLSQDWNCISSRSAWVLMSEPIIFRVRFGKRSLVSRCGPNVAGVWYQIPIRRLCHTGSTCHLVCCLPALCLLPSWETRAFYSPPTYCSVPERPGQERQEGISSNQRLKQQPVPFALREYDPNTDNPEPIKSSQCLIEVVLLLATALSSVLNVIKIVLMAWSHDGVCRLYIVVAIAYSLIL